MKVIFIPNYSQGNPYQKNLIESLLKQDINVNFGVTSRLFSVWLSILKRGKPDILHLHWQHPFLIASSRVKTLIKSITFILELLFLKILGTKIVWTVHNLKNHENQHQKLEFVFSSILARLSDTIITHCQRAKLVVKKTFNIKNDVKIVVIPHGNYSNCYNNQISSSESRKRLGLSASNLIFLYLGLIRPYKGVPELIDAFQKLNVSQTKLIIAGEPSNNQIAEEIERKAKGNDNIWLVFKFIPDEEMQIYLNAADVMVFPYREILTTGGVILAMSFGKAIIAPNIGCIPDILNGSGSFLYDPDEENGLLNAMKRALISKDRLKKMGNYNLELAKKLDWMDIAKSTYRVYERCLKNANLSNN